MTRRGDDAAERDAVTAAMLRILSGSAIKSVEGLSVSGLAKEAGYPRHVLTHKHTDLRDTWVEITRRSQISEAAPGQQLADQAGVIEALKDELRGAKEINAALTAQLAAAVLRVEELERRTRRGRESRLRSLD